MLRIKFFIIIFLFTFSVEAAHIVGGDVSYKCVYYDAVNDLFKIEIILTIYRDSENGGAVLDDPGEIGVFIGSQSNWSHFNTLHETLKSKISLDVVSPNPCLQIPSNIGVEEGVYRFTLTLPVSDKSYMVAYQRCCRNVSITNIVSPESAGAAFTIEITPEAQISCNDSPVFDNFPPIIICADDDLIFDHSATDAQGDQIIYDFCNPYTAGGTRGVGGEPGSDACDGVTPSPVFCRPPFDKVIFNNGTSFSNPIPGSPNLSIDPQTGIITGNPTLPGQYVVGVCAKEYRNGVLIGEIRRDFQFNVADCKPLVYADIEADDSSDLPEQSVRINSCGENTVLFINKSFKESNINEYMWEFDINGNIVTIDTKNASVTFPDVGTYHGIMALNPGTTCADTVLIEVNIFPSINADFSFEYDTCNAGPVQFTDLSSTGSIALTGWDWNMANENSTDIQNPNYTFNEPGDKIISLIVTDDNTCSDTIYKNVKYFPVPSILIIEPSKFIGCAPESVYFNNRTTPLDTNYTLNWDFGDGNLNSGHVISPTHRYTDPGVYDVTLQIISPIGCEFVKTFPSWVTIKDKPFADFIYSPEEPSVFNREVEFINKSIDAIRYAWNFGKEGSSFEKDITITFQDTGSYDIRLIVINDEDCTDTSYATIQILAPTILQFPNAFTPNNDALNDVFEPKGFFTVLKAYEFLIFNRWGEHIFKTNDPTIGWNGQKNNNGILSPIGVYVYLVKYIDEKGKSHILKGHVNLIR